MDSGTLHLTRAVHAPHLLGRDDDEDDEEEDDDDEDDEEDDEQEDDDDLCLLRPLSERSLDSERSTPLYWKKI